MYLTPGNKLPPQQELELSLLGLEMKVKNHQYSEMLSRIDELEKRIAVLEGKEVL